MLSTPSFQGIPAVVFWDPSFVREQVVVVTRTCACYTCGKTSAARCTGAGHHVESARLQLGEWVAAFAADSMY